MRRIAPLADELGIAVLAPDSRESTWDAIRGEFGPDVDFIDRALGHVFDRVAVDPARVAVGGFSDGATYALSLGLINGDLFRRVLAFSPGFVIERGKQGRPRFFISHGIADPVLPIDRCSRRIVPALQKGGYDVTFREFSGGHTVPPEIAREGLPGSPRDLAFVSNPSCGWPRTGRPAFHPTAQRTRGGDPGFARRRLSRDTRFWRRAQSGAVRGQDPPPGF